MHWVTDPSTSPAEERVRRAASRELRAIPGVRNFGAHIGQAFLAEEVVGVNFGENWISVDDSADLRRDAAAVTRSSTAIRAVPRRADLPERAHRGGPDRVQRPSSSGSSGQDLNALREKAEEVNEIMGGIDGVVDNHVDVPGRRAPDPGPGEARQGRAVWPQAGRRSTRGADDDRRRRGRRHLPGREAYDVLVWSTPESRNSLAEHGNMLHRHADRAAGPPGDVADVAVRPTPNLIKREGARDASTSRPTSRGATSARSATRCRRSQRHHVRARLPRRAAGEYAERQAAQRRLLNSAASPRC